MEGRPLAEQELVDRARRGDESAYATLVDMHQTIAFRTAYLVLRDASEAEDVTQDAFVKAFDALGRFRRGAPFRPWLLRIVVNEARNSRRSAGRRWGLTLRAAEQGPRGEAAPSPEGALLGSEERAELLRAVDGLREEERLVVACRFFLDLSEGETARVLGIRPGTAKSRLSRALARLRDQLAEAAHA